MAGLEGEAVADAGGAGGGVGEASGGDDDSVGAECGAVLQTHAVAVVGETLDGAVLMNFDIGALLEVVDEGQEYVERLAAAGIDAVAAFLDQRHVALLEEVHELGVEKLGKAVAHPTTVRTNVGEEILERGGVGEVAAAFTGDA